MNINKTKKTICRLGQECLPLIEAAYPGHIVLFTDNTYFYTIIKLGNFQASRMLTNCKNGHDELGFRLFSSGVTSFMMTLETYDLCASYIKDTNSEVRPTATELVGSAATMLIQQVYSDQVVLYHHGSGSYTIYDIDAFKSTDRYICIGEGERKDGLIDDGDWAMAEETYDNLQAAPELETN